MDWTKRLAVWSVVIGTIVLGLKYFAYYLTGSIALYSDALESIVNVATAVAALFAVHVSAEPADTGHPFGHSKVEYFSAVIEGVLIVLAALSILRQAYMGFLNPTPLDAPLLGMAVNGAAGVLNALWCRDRCPRRDNPPSTDNAARRTRRIGWRAKPG
jgi:cation diffusion facilitator family transporter